MWRIAGDQANLKFIGQINASFSVSADKSNARGSSFVTGSSSGLPPLLAASDIAPYRGTGSAHPNYFRPRMAVREFGIRHYAGDVVYDVTGFNEKNMESLTEDLKDLVMGSVSSNRFLAEVCQVCCN